MPTTPARTYRIVHVVPKLFCVVRDVIENTINMNRMTCTKYPDRKTARNEETKNDQGDRQAKEQTLESLTLKEIRKYAVDRIAHLVKTTERAGNVVLCYSYGKDDDRI